MKKIILLILVGITFLGCNDNLDNSIVTTLNKTDADNRIKPPPAIIYTWLYASKLVDGSIGADFIFDTTFVNHDGREINVFSRLKFEPGAFSGIKEIVMLPNAENLSIKLFPEMTFNAEVKLTVIFTGISVKEHGYNVTGHVDFVFFLENGGYKRIEAELTHVNVPQDQIKVMNAKLHHFSRYGWIR